MKMEAPIHLFPPGKWRWSAFEVPLKCRWSANRQQPTATAVDLPLLTPPLSTVGWSKITSFNHLGKEVDPPEVSVSRRHGHIHTQTEGYFVASGPDFHWIGIKSPCPSFCASVCLWQFKTPSPGGRRDLWSKGLTLIVACYDTFFLNDFLAIFLNKKNQVFRIFLQPPSKKMNPPQTIF